MNLLRELLTESEPLKSIFSQDEIDDAVKQAMRSSEFHLLLKPGPKVTGSLISSKTQLKRGNLEFKFYAHDDAKAWDEKAYTLYANGTIRGFTTTSKSGAHSPSKYTVPDLTADDLLKNYKLMMTRFTKSSRSASSSGTTRKAGSGSRVAPASISLVRSQPFK
jgi:hypothetical protein